MIRMVTAGKLCDGVVAALGWSAAAYSLSGKDRITLTDAMNDAIMTAYDRQKWPQLMQTEHRTYRPQWDAAEAYTKGMEVYVEDSETDSGIAYYVLVANSSINDDPALDDGTVWERVEEILPFIQFVQPWERWAIDERGFDVKAFAFASDPRGNPDLQPIAGCRVDSMGGAVVLPKGEVPDKVWVRFIADRPRLDFTEWADDEAYATGDVRYRTSTGRCYVSLEDANEANAPEDSPTKWAEVSVPEFIAKYVRLYAQGQWLDADHGARRAQQAADIELERLERAYFESMGVNEGTGYSCGR